MAEHTLDSEPIILEQHDRYARLTEIISRGRVLLLTSQSVSKLPSFKKLCDELKPLKLCVVKDVKPNPTSEYLDSVFTRIRDFKPLSIVAFGGGSVIDSGKALKGLLANKHAGSTSYLIQSDELYRSDILLAAIPTTAGTGSEVTPFATIWTGQGGGKESIDSPTIKPNVVLLDPSLIASAPVSQLLYSGLDAISHCIETIWNKHKTEVSQRYAVLGLRKILDVLPKILNGIHAIDNFQELQTGAFLAGQAISINRTAIAHSISYPLTAYLGVPHGLACSFTIPTIYRNLYVKSSNLGDTYQILEESVNFIESLDLSESLLNYGDVAQFIGVGASMTINGRIENFEGAIERFNLEDLLFEALSTKSGKGAM